MADTYAAVAVDSPVAPVATVSPAVEPVPEVPSAKQDITADKLDAAAADAKKKADDKKKAELSVVADLLKKRMLDVPPAEGSIVKRVFHLTRPPFGLIVIGCIAACGEGLMPIIFYWLFGDLVGVLAVPGAPGFVTELNRIASWMAGIAGIACVCGFTKEVCLSRASTRIGITVREKLFLSILQQEIGFFDATKTGTLLSMLSEDIATLQQGYGADIGKLCQFLAQFLAGIIMAFTKSWEMSLVILGVAPVLGAGLGIQSKLTERFTVRASEASARAVSSAEEVVTSMRTVRSFSAETREVSRFRNDLSAIEGIDRVKSFLAGGTYGIVMFVIWGSAALAFWFGGTRVQNGTLQVGDVVTVFGLMLMAVLGLAQAVGQMQGFTKAAAAGAVLFGLIERKPRINFEGGLPHPTTTGCIDFDNVVFKYPTRDEQVLHGVSLSIKTGEKIAFVGSSGSGKSTVFQLLQRFYDPQEGAIFLDGVDIRQIEPRELRRHLAVVSQEPILFACSVADNIRYGRPDASMEDVIAAAKKANAHTFVSEFDNGYETILGEKGVSLSGGQKQRVAIARAILSDPKILLLDEATSALDTESEKLVQEALDAVMAGRTSLVIAHRLSTVLDASRLYVMAKGRIVQAGTHETLLADSTGLYAKLAARQLLGKKGDPDAEIEAAAREAVVKLKQSGSNTPAAAAATPPPAGSVPPMQLEQGL